MNAQRDAWNKIAHEIKELIKKIASDSINDFIKLSDIAGLDILSDFQGVDLEGSDLQEVDLREADLRWCNLQGANLSEAKLQGAKLAETNLSGAILHGADLRQADLRQANLSDVDLRGADLRGADLREANLRAAKLNLANIEGAKLQGAHLEDISFDQLRWGENTLERLGTLITPEILPDWLSLVNEIQRSVELLAKTFSRKREIPTEAYFSNILRSIPKRLFSTSMEPYYRVEFTEKGKVRFRRRYLSWYSKYHNPPITPIKKVVTEHVYEFKLVSSYSVPTIEVRTQYYYSHIDMARRAAEILISADSAHVGFVGQILRIRLPLRRRHNRGRRRYA